MASCLHWLCRYVVYSWFHQHALTEIIMFRAKNNYCPVAIRQWPEVRKVAFVWAGNSKTWFPVTRHIYFASFWPLRKEKKKERKAVHHLTKNWSETTFLKQLNNVHIFIPEQCSHLFHMDMLLLNKNVLANKATYETRRLRCQSIQWMKSYLICLLWKSFTFWFVGMKKLLGGGSVACSKDDNDEHGDTDENGIFWR